MCELLTKAVNHSAGHKMRWGKVSRCKLAGRKTTQAQEADDHTIPAAHGPSELIFLFCLLVKFIIHHFNTSITIILCVFSWPSILWEAHQWRVSSGELLWSMWPLVKSRPYYFEVKTAARLPMTHAVCTAQSSANFESWAVWTKHHEVISCVTEFWIRLTKLAKALCFTASVNQMGYITSQLCLFGKAMLHFPNQNFHRSQNHRITWNADAQKTSP